MKGSARIIGNISGRANSDGVAVGEAVTASMLTKGDALVMGVIAAGAYDVGILTAEAMSFGHPTTGNAGAEGMIGGDASRTRDAGCRHWLDVEPTETQEVVWLDPYGIDYYVTTSTNLKWRII